MNNNSGTKVLVVILIIVCLFQGCSLTSANETMEDLQNRVYDLEFQCQKNADDITALEYELNLLKNGESSESEICTFKRIDAENGIVVAEFKITPKNINDTTKVVISNTVQSIEMTRSGNTFVGTLEYPIDEEFYETIYYVYDGDVQKEEKEIAALGAGNILVDVIFCEFADEPRYGNDRLTLAGLFAYQCEFGETITSSKLVFGDEELDLGTLKANKVSINMSETISLDDEKMFEEMYVEFTMKSGAVYRVYPCLNAGYSNKINSDSDERISAYQERAIVIISPDGDMYRTRY